MSGRQKSNSRVEQQSSASYELIPRFQPLLRINSDYPIKNSSIALNVNAIKMSRTPVNRPKNQKIDYNQSTQRTKRIPTPSKHEPLSHFQTLQYRKTISQLTLKINQLQTSLSKEQQQHQLDRKANQIYFSFFGRLKSMFQMQQISQIMGKIEEMKRSHIEIDNKMSQMNTNWKKQPLIRQDYAKMNSLAQLKNQRQTDLYNELELCQAKICQLRSQLLRSSENNIFSLLNMPFSASPASPGNSINLQDYKNFKLRINELEQVNERLQKDAFQAKTFYNNQINILKHKNQLLLNEKQDLIAKVERFEDQIAQKCSKIQKLEAAYSKQIQNQRILVSRNYNQENKDYAENAVSITSNFQYKTLINLIENLRQQQKESTQHFRSFKEQVFENFSTQNEKIFEIQKNRQLIIQLSQRLNALIQSFNTPEIANVQTMKSMEKSFEPQTYINQIKSLKQKIDDNQRHIQRQILEKQRLQQRIQQIQQGKEVSMNESFSRIKKLESKLRIKSKRITELQNTIIDHLQNNSKRQLSSMINATNVNMTQKQVSPQIIQKYENNIRNFKVLLNTARKQNQKLKQQLNQANHQRTIKIKALELLEDHNSALKQFSQRISNSKIAREDLNLNVSKVIDDFKSEIDLIRNQQIQISLLEAQNKRRKSSYFSKPNNTF